MREIGKMGTNTKRESINHKKGKIGKRREGKMSVA
jgi:hypothetical protein